MAARTGAAASEEFSRSANFESRLKYLNWATDVEARPEGILMRFVTSIDDWPVVDTHMFTPTKEKPAKWKSDKWPASMPAVCSLDPLFYDDAAMAAAGSTSPIYLPGFGKCYIHENYADKKDRFGRPFSVPQTITYALVVLRERTKDGIQDRTDKWKPEEGEEITIPMFRVVSSQWGNFFSAVAAGAFEDKSVQTKDFLVKKKPKSSPEVSPLSVTRNHHPAVTDNEVLGTAPATESWQRYLDKLALMGEAGDLMADLRRQASEDHIRRWFEPGPWDEQDDTESPDAGSEVAEEPSQSELTPEMEAELAAVRERLLKGQKVS